MPLRQISLMLAISWMVTLFYLSHQSSITVLPGSFAHVDKLYHATAYGLLGGLWLFSLRPKADGFSRLQVLLCVSIASLYGISDEVHQSFVPGRSADWLDWVADTTGALLVCVLVMHLSQQKFSLLKQGTS